MLSLDIFSILTLLLSAKFVPTALSQSYAPNAQFKGKDFLGAFNWETFDDPTHGRVNFVNQGTALNTNLSYGMVYYLPTVIQYLYHVQLTTTYLSCERIITK